MVMVFSLSDAKRKEEATNETNVDENSEIKETENKEMSSKNLDTDEKDGKNIKKFQANENS